MIKKYIRIVSWIFFAVGIIGSLITKDLYSIYPILLIISLIGILFTILSKNQGITIQTDEKPETPITPASPPPITENSKTQKCSWCAMEIQKEATICPYCRKSTNKLSAIGDNMMKTGLQLTCLPWAILLLIACVVIVITLTK